jgi:glyceraldehyde 3-phosphate dehydrogenase
MAVRIGIHGFGRIGRNVFRLLYARRKEFDVRCVADVAAPESLVYLLNFDSIHGRFPEEVRYDHGHMYVNGRSVPLVYSREPGEVRWREYDVDIVVECAGKYRTRAVLERHIEAGARRVVLTNPPGEDMLGSVFCVGVNDEKVDRTHKVISCSSPTSNALSIMVKVLDEAFGLERASMTTIHAYTNELRLADFPHKQLRRSRAAAENIIPSNTFAVRVAENLMPHLKGRINGMALNVPVPDGSCIDMTAVLRRRCSPGEVNGAVRSAAKGYLKGILDYTEQPVVSSDVIGNPHTAVFDGLATKVLGGNLVKTITWYDNGWGYANRVVDLIERLARTL